MIVFVDSVVWIGAKLKNDQWYEQSNKIIRQFAEISEKFFHINDFVVLETVNFLLRKGGFDTASATLKLFREHEQIEIIHMTDKLLEQTYDFFIKYKGLSITDASIVAIMHQFGITKLYSFDGGFDKVPGIERLYY